MMAPQPTFRDSELSAWLDGEYEARPDEHARIEAWLNNNPDAAARVAQWSGDRGALQSRLGPLLDEPVPEALQRLVWRRRAQPRWAMAAAAAGLLLAGGVVGAWIGAAARSAPPVQATAAGTAAGWVERAAFAHNVFVPEPRHAVEVKAQEEHLSRWLTARIKLPVKLFDLREQGFELVGGRLLPDGPGKSAQLMYQDAQGVRVTVYLRKPEAGADAAFQYERQGDLGLFYWVEEGLGYALVGALPRERLLALAEAIYRQKPEMPGAGASAPKS